MAQKNAGHGYLNDVFRGLQLSPGNVYKKHAQTINRKRLYVSRYKSTAAYKRRRLNARKLQYVSQVTSEVREGKTYDSGIDLSPANADILTIPKPVEAPVYKLAKNRDMHVVFFDLETTSLKKTVTFCNCLPAVITTNLTD